LHADVGTDHIDALTPTGLNLLPLGGRWAASH